MFFIEVSKGTNDLGEYVVVLKNNGKNLKEAQDILLNFKRDKINQVIVEVFVDGKSVGKEDFLSASYLTHKDAFVNLTKNQKKLPLDVLQSLIMTHMPTNWIILSR